MIPGVSKIERYPGGRSAVRRVSQAGRLTLSSAVPVTTSDVTAATSVYWTPYSGDVLWIKNGPKFAPYQCSEMTLALDSAAADTGYHQSGKNFDVFGFRDGGKTRIGTGPTWNSGAGAGSDTARGTGAGSTELELVNGIYVNKNQIQLRWGNGAGNLVTVAKNQATYLGTFRTTADGQTEDSAAKRFLWNNYNRVRRAMSRYDTTDTWNYTTATWRQANGSTANQLDYVCGLAEDAVCADVTASMFNSTGTTGVNVGVGVDSTTSPSGKRGNQTTNSAANSFSVYASYVGVPGLGRHYLAWLEISGGVGTTSWQGDNGGTLLQSGIEGEVMG